MSEVKRICPQCGEGVALQARYCGECGYDTNHGLPVQRSTLPMAVTRAALPVVAGLAGLVLRTGWKLLQAQLTQAASRQAASSLARRPLTPTTDRSQHRSHRVIRIRSFWAVGDASGVWRQGKEEHTIEIDE